MTSAPGSMLAGLLRPHVAVTSPPVAGYTAWWDPSDLSSLTVSGSTVTKMNDKSGGGHDMIGGATGSSNPGPASGADTINGLNVLKYNGGTTFMVTSAALFGAALSSVTVFAVHKATAAVAISNLGIVSGDEGSGSVGQPRLWQQRWSTPTVPQTVAFQSIGVGNVATGAGATDIRTLAQVFATVVDGRAGGSVANFINGTLNGSTSSSTWLSSNPKCALGVATYGLISGFWNGDIGEVIVYPSALITADRQSVESYLRAKWATP